MIKMLHLMFHTSQKTSVGRYRIGSYLAELVSVWKMNLCRSCSQLKLKYLGMFDELVPI